MWEIILIICLFFSGFAAKALYDSIRERWFANKLIKKWGKMKDMTIKAIDAEYSDGKFQFIKED